MINCRKCGAANRVAANFCQQCGYPQRGAITYPLSFCAAQMTLDTFFAFPVEQAPVHVQPLLQTIIDFRQVLWREEIQIAFFGTFKSGKSTLLNALMHADVVPTRVLRATGIITELYYADQPGAYMRYQMPDGTVAPEPVAFDDRIRYILLDLEQTDDPAATNAEVPDSTAIALGIPHPLLQRGCILVDTPGLMDDHTLTASSYRELARSDLAVMVISAYQLLSQNEKDAARQTHQLLHGNVVFMINQMDTVAAEDRAAVIDRAHMILQAIGNDMVGQPRIFSTAALLAFAARTRSKTSPTAQDSSSGDDIPDDMTIAAGEGLAAFEHWLTDLLEGATRQRVMLRARLGILTRHLSRLAEIVQGQLDAAVQATERAQQAASSAQAEHQARLRNAIVDDGLRLGRLDNQLDSLGESFVTGCVANVQHMIQTDQQWPGKLRTCFRQALQEYRQQVLYGVGAALIATRMAVPPFHLDQPPVQAEITAAEEWIAGLGFLSGLLPGIVAPPLSLDLPPFQLPRSPIITLFEQTIGTVVGDIVHQTRTEAHQQILQAVEQAAQTLRPHLQKATRHYLKQVHTLLQEVSSLPDTDLSALDALAVARQTENRYQHLADWCAEFQAAVARAEHALEI